MNFSNPVRVKACVPVLATLVLGTLLLAACAPTVKVRSDADPSVNFSQYRTKIFSASWG